MASAPQNRRSRLFGRPGDVWLRVRAVGYIVTIVAMLAAYGTQIGDDRPWLIVGGFGLALLAAGVMATWGRGE